MEAAEILKKITDFDVKNNYYKDEQKDEIIDLFKELFFIDEPSVRKFLEDFINQTKSLADKHGLLSDEEEKYKDKDEEGEESGEEKSEEDAEEEVKEEPEEEPSEKENSEGEPEEEEKGEANDEKEEDDEEKKESVRVNVTSLIKEKYRERANDYLI